MNTLFDHVHSVRHRKVSRTTSKQEIGIRDGNAECIAQHRTRKPQCSRRASVTFHVRAASHKGTVPYARCALNPHVVPNARVVLRIPAAHRARADWCMFMYMTECSALPYRIIIRYIIDALRGDKLICAR